MGAALIGALLWLLVADAGATAPLVWWVRSEDEAALVEAALQEMWPSAPVQVRVSPDPGAEASGVTLDARAGLQMQRGGALWARPDVTDPHTAAALVRSWHTSADLTAPPEEPSIPLSPAPDRPPPPQPWGGGFVAGPAQRRPQPGPAFHFAAQAVGPRWVLSAEYDPAERVVISTEAGGLLVRRAGLTAGVRAERPGPGAATTEVALSAGIRLHAYAELQQANVMALQLMPTAAARLRLWAPSRTSRLRLGGGMMVSHDGMSWSRWYADGARARPLTIAAELGALQATRKKN